MIVVAALLLRRIRKRSRARGRRTGQQPPGQQPPYSPSNRKSFLDEQSVLSHLTFDNSMNLADGLDDDATAGSPNGGKTINYPPLHGRGAPLPSGTGAGKNVNLHEKEKEGELR